MEVKGIYSIESPSIPVSSSNTMPLHISPCPYVLVEKRELSNSGLSLSLQLEAVLSINITVVCSPGFDYNTLRIKPHLNIVLKT